MWETAMASENKSTTARRVPVLIVGGGPVGLALAIELGWRGIPCELIEQTDGAIASPKMNEVNIRTMEFCRRWGIADDVMNCPFPADFPLDVAFITNMFGYELGRVPRPARNDQTAEPHSPMRFQVCSQIWFDPILQRTAQRLPNVTLSYRHRLEAFTQSDAGVTAEVADLDSGRRIKISADYMVGCDGTTSLVRGMLGIELEGAGTIGNPVNMFFRAPKLLAASGKNPATFFFPVDAGGTWGTLRVIDPQNGLWRLMSDRSNETSVEQVDRERHLRRALGRSFEVEWVDVNIWKRRSVVAESYGRGRVLLAGDAVHQLSPTGALGMNSGIGDAVDLGWKLAAVLQGWGGNELVASYDLERRPVGHRNVRMATSFYKNLEKFDGYDAAIEHDGPAGDAARRKLGAHLVADIGREFRTIGLQIGYRYDASPLCIADGTDPPPDDPATYHPSARPGARAPHVWLRDGRSILDHFGRGFTLLCFGAATGATAITNAAARRQIPLALVPLDDQEAAALYGRRLVLVRPDGHVAWRGDAPPADPVAMIDQVRGAAIDRSGVHA